MKKNKTRHLWRSKIYINTCLLVVIPLLVVGGGFSMIYSSNVQQNLITQNEDYLAMTTARLEQALSNIETQSAQWIKVNVGNTSSSQGNAFAKDYLSLMRLVNSLEVFKNSNDWMSRVIYRHGATGTVLDSEYGMVLLKGYRYWDQLSKLQADDFPSGWYRFDEGVADEVALVNRLPRNAFGGQDMLVITVSGQRLATEIKPLPRILPGAEFVLLDRYNQIFYPADAVDDLPPEIDLPTLRIGTGSFFFSRNGEEMVSTYAVGFSGWKLFATGPRSAVFAEASWVWQMALSIMGVGALLSVLCILIFSRWVYKPFQGLLDTFTRISPEQGNPASTGKAAHMLDEVAYFQNTIANVQQEKIAYMGRWQMVSQVVVQQYLQLLLRNDQYAALESLPDTLPHENRVIVGTMQLQEKTGDESPLLSQDRPLAFSAIENIARELLVERPRLYGNLLSQYPAGFAVVFFPDRLLGEEDVLSDVRAFWQRLQQVLSDHLEIPITAMTIGVGRLYDDQLDASLSYNDALMAMRYHLLGGHQVDVCFYGEVIGDIQEISLNYPRAAEARILGNLKEGKPDAARENLEAFGRQVQQSGSYPFCRQAYLLLLSGLIQTLIREERGAEAVLKDNPIESFDKCVSITDMQAFIAERVFPIFARQGQQEDSDDSAQRIVAYVQHFVEENITSDLSLQQCADAVGISVSYLSRIFKRISGVAFLEYVTRKKIDYVKEKLRTSQKSIGEIATQIGYSERNLYRTFVKLENMSPGGYREKHRAE